jgi:3-methyladenine DNA glycosylase AlkD
MKGRLRSSSIPTKRSKPRGSKTTVRPLTVWTVSRAMIELRRLGSRDNVEGMARFGILTKKAFGVATPDVERLARSIGRNHALGMRLWETGNHDARTLAVLVSDARLVNAAHMERWVKEFDNWSVCDGACCHLFAEAAPAWRKALAWTRREKEFEKRAGFALAAYLAVHDKTAKDKQFEPILKAIEREAWDERNFVRKAVNWALRNIGKRNQRLNRRAIASAERIRKRGTRAGRWIATDALRELTSEAVQTRLKRQKP